MDRDIYGESNLWSTSELKKLKNIFLMLMLCLNETIDQLAMTNSVFVGMAMC